MPRLRSALLVLLVALAPAATPIASAPAAAPADESPIAANGVSPLAADGVNASRAAAARAAKRPKVTCKAGTIPKIIGSGTRAKLVRKRGKAVCVKPPRAKPSQIEAAPTTQQGAISSTADQLTQALLVKPDALARAQRKLGKKATKALVDRAMLGWRTGARAHATRLAADGGYHYEGNFGDAAKGTTGSARLDAGPAGDGGQGVKASATIEFSADGKGLKSLGASNVTSAKSAKVRLDISFQDAPTACPTAAGKVKGTLTASATLTLTTDGTTQTIAAKVSATYELTVGPNARWQTIDNVDLQTEFSFGGSGQKTETWRGRRGGSGFGQRGIFGEGSGKFEDAFAEQQSHLNPNQGGVWGPRGRVRYDDPSTDNVFNYGGSIAHLKGMVLTDIATTYLTFAAVEYVRHVVGPRGDKHWYDAEACAQLTATPNRAELGPGETATITVRDAKAADGTLVAASLRGSGVASLVPGTASIAAGASFDFTLTAPNETPAKASWRVVSLSPAGKKTLTGSLADEPRWLVTLQTTETYITAGYRSDASLQATAVMEPIAASEPPRWNGAAPLQWSNITGQDEDGCALSDPVAGGTFVAEVSRSGGGQIAVALGVSVGSQVTWNITCPDSEGAAQVPGPSPVILNGTVITLPESGGTQPLRVEVTDGPDGVARSEGTITVTPIG